MWNSESDQVWHWDLNLRRGVPVLSCFPGPENACGSSLHSLKIGLWEETSQRRQLEVKLWVINMFIHHRRTVPQRIQVSFHCVFNSGMLLLSCQQILVRKWVGSYREGCTASAQCSRCDWLDGAYDTKIVTRGQFGSALITLRLEKCVYSAQIKIRISMRVEGAGCGSWTRQP